MIQGVSEAGRVDLLCRHGRPPAGARGRHPHGSGRPEPVLVHRRGRQQRHAQQRPLPDQPEAARRAQRERRRRDPRACRSETAGIAGITLYMQPVQDLTLDTTVSRTQYQFTLESADADGSVDLDTEARRRRCASSPSSPTWSATRRTTASPPTSPSIATARRASASASARWTTRCTMPSASGSSPPSSPSRISIGSSWRRIPRRYRSVDSLASIYVPSAAGGQVPLSAIAKVDVETRPLLINHLAQFPATTVSFNLAPGASLGAAVDAIEKRRARRSDCRRASAPLSRARRSRSAAT